MCGDYAYAQFNMGIIHLEEMDHYNPIRARQHFAKAVQIDPLMRYVISSNCGALVRPLTTFIQKEHPLPLARACFVAVGGSGTTKDG